MKKIIIFAIFASVATVWFWGGKDLEDMNSEKSFQDSLEKNVIHEGKVASAKGSEREKATTELPENDRGNYDALRGESQEVILEQMEEARDIIDNIEIYDWLDLQSRLQKLKEKDGPHLAELLISKFKKLTPNDEMQRSRVIEVAKFLDSPYMVELWVDLLERRTPLFEDEASLLAEDDPHEIGNRIIQTEQKVAIRELGQISRDATGADEVLWRIVRGEVAFAQSLGMRMYAFENIRENDSAALVKLAAVLSADDPLHEAVRRSLD